MYQTYKNLTIRDAVPADANVLSAWWNDGSIMEHAGYHRGTGETPDMIAADIRKDSDMTNRHLIIEENIPDFLLRKNPDLHSTDRIPIGEMGYRNVNHGTAEIGIKICNTSAGIWVTDTFY